MTDMFVPMQQDALTRREEEFEADLEQAEQEGEHFWIFGVFHRKPDGPLLPGEDLYVEPENVAHMTPVYCAACGATDNLEPRCQGRSAL